MLNCTNPKRSRRCEKAHRIHIEMKEIKQFKKRILSCKKIGFFGDGLSRGKASEQFRRRALS